MQLGSTEVQHGKTIEHDVVFTHKGRKLTEGGRGVSASASASSIAPLISWLFRLFWGFEVRLENVMLSSEPSCGQQFDHTFPVSTHV